MAEEDRPNLPTARFICSPKELTGKDTGSVVTTRYNRIGE